MHYDVTSREGHGLGNRGLVTSGLAVLALAILATRCAFRNAQRGPFYETRCIRLTSRRSARATWIGFSGAARGVEIAAHWDEDFQVNEIIFRNTLQESIGFDVRLFSEGDDARKAPLFHRLMAASSEDFPPGYTARSRVGGRACVAVGALRLRTDHSIDR